MESKREYPQALPPPPSLPPSRPSRPPLDTLCVSVTRGGGFWISSIVTTDRDHFVGPLWRPLWDQYGDLPGTIVVAVILVPDAAGNVKASALLPPSSTSHAVFFSPFVMSLSVRNRSVNWLPKILILRLIITWCAIASHSCYSSLTVYNLVRRIYEEENVPLPDHLNNRIFASQKEARSRDHCSCCFRWVLCILVWLRGCWKEDLVHSMSGQV